MGLMKWALCFQVCVEGVLENLTDNDRAKIMEDDVNTFATYLQFGTGLEGEISFEL